MNFVPLLKDSTTTTGTGNITTLGAAIGFQSLTAIGAVGSTFDYTIRMDGSAVFEEGVGTLLTATTFSRMPSNGGSPVSLPAGTKDVIVGPTAARAKKFDAGTSPRVVYLSNFCTSDTVLLPYAQVAGTDQRAKIQAVLDLAKTQPLHLVWDVKVTVANAPGGIGDTLLISPNTTIVALNGCGALWAAGSTGAMLSNANPTTNANNTAASITDENITIDGGIWHGNREGQTVKANVFRFSGVRNLRTVNYTIYRPNGMCFRLINIDGHINENYTLNQGVDILTASNSVYINTDGMHYHGPQNNIRDRNGRILYCGDDSYALNADDAWGAGTFTDRFDNVYGPITDVKVDNLYFNPLIFGIRILSAGSRVDAVRFRNVSGATSAYGFLIDNYLTPAQAVSPGPGNVGSVEVDGWNVTNSYVAFDWGQMSMHISAKCEQVKLRNINKRDFNNALFPIVRIGEKANIDQLEISYNSRNYNNGTYLTEQVDFVSGSKVTQARIIAQTYSASAVTGSPIRVRSGATITQLELTGSGLNFTSTLQSEGAISNLHNTSYMDATSNASSTWTLQSGAPWGEDVANPGSLTYTGPYTGVVGSAKKKVADTFGGNVKVTARWLLTGTITPNYHVAVFARGSSTVPWSGAQNVYYFDINMLGTPQLNIGKKVSGTDSIIAGPSNPSALVAGVAYDISIVAKATTISAIIQRVSDGFYMQTNGTFAATVAAVLTATDTSLAAASGEIGVYVFAEGASTTNLTNFTAIAAP